MDEKDEKDSHSEQIVILEKEDEKDSHSEQLVMLNSEVDLNKEDKEESPIMSPNSSFDSFSFEETSEDTHSKQLLILEKKEGEESLLRQLVNKLNSESNLNKEDKDESQKRSSNSSFDSVSFEETSDSLLSDDSGYC